jgi:hypothetical protein
MTAPTAQVVELHYAAGLLDCIDDRLGDFACVEAVGALVGDPCHRPGIRRPLDDVADCLELTLIGKDCRKERVLAQQQQIRLGEGLVGSHG